MIKEILIEHLKYIDDHLEFSKKASELDKAFILNNEFVLNYDGYVILSDKGHELLNKSCNVMLEIDIDDMIDFNVDDEDFQW